MDLRKLKKLIDLVQESGIAELEVTEGEEKVRIARVGQGGGYMPAPQHAMVHMPAPAAPALAAPAAAAPAEEQLEGHVVKSPMVGTFYRSPSPGAKVFVEVGDTVSPGDTLCIIEAMKLMNEVQSEVSGRITEIKVENGQAVEYGQELFLVAPA